MIIVNEKADYSACGLGKVHYLTDEVKLKLSTNFPSLTYDEMLAVQVFLDNLGYGQTGGLYSKLKYLCFPILTKGVLGLNAFYDIISDSIKKPNAITAENLATYYTMSVDGMDTIYSTETIDFGINVATDVKTFSPFALFKKKSDSEYTNLRIAFLDSGNNYCQIRNSTYYPQFIKNDGTRNHNLVLEVSGSNVCSFSSSSLFSEGKFQINSNLGKASMNVNSSFASVPKDKFYIGGYYHNGYNGFNIQVFGFGDDISMAESEVINSALIELKEALGI